MAKKCRSDAFAAIHEMMEGLHEVGAIDKQAMCEFDEACLTPKGLQNLSLPIWLHETFVAKQVRRD